MITLPVTCNQLATIILCAIFAGGVYLMYDYWTVNVGLFMLGLFVAGFPTVVGLCYFIWYSCVFLDKNVRCKCE